MATGALLLPNAAAPFGTAPERSSLVNTGVGVVQPDVAGAVFTQNLPITANIRELDGYALHSYADDFYNRLFIIPQIVNVGGSTTTQFREILVWSAYNVTTELAAINLTDFTGLSILDIAVADTFLPLQFRAARLSINPVGPREIDATAEFVLTNGDAGVLTVIGERGELAVFQPSWTGPLSETIEYKTTVSSSINNREQRSAERYEPRVTVAYPLLATEARQPRLREFFRSKGHERTATVLWSHYIRVDAADPGETALTADFIPSWVQPGIVVAAYDPNGTKHDSPILGQIAAINRDLGTVTLESGFAFPLRQGTRLYRYIAAWFARGQSLTFQTNQIASASLSYLVDPLGFVFNDLSGIDVPEFAGYPIFSTPHNWAAGLTVSYSRDEDVLDYGQGVIQRDPNADFTTEVFQLDFLRIGYERASEVRDHFTRMRGRRGEFWRSSFTDDLTVLVAPVVTGTTLTFAGADTGVNYQNDVTKRAIEVTLLDGTVRRYTLSELVPDLNNDTTVATLEQPWADVGGASIIVKCRWLYLCRFASDSMTIEWLTDETAQIRINIQTLPVEPSE